MTSPPHPLSSSTPPILLRLYDAYPVVEMPYQRREEGYAALGGYIDGDNSDQTKFAYSQVCMGERRRSGDRRRGSPTERGPTGSGKSPPSTKPSEPLHILFCLRSQPVIMRYYAGGDKAMQMYLGSRTLRDGSSLPAARPAEFQQLPAPLSSQAAVAVAGGELVAVFRFEGFITPTSAEAARKQLQAALKAGEGVEGMSGGENGRAG
jgi:hypothetical protein